MTRPLDPFAHAWCAIFFLLICAVFLKGETHRGDQEYWAPTCVSGEETCCKRPKTPKDVCGSQCSFSSNWVEEHAPHWSVILSEFACEDDAGFDVLEVGSFEGRSALWFLSNLHIRTITCVDTFQGGEEQSLLGNPKLAVLEETFDSNMRAAGVGTGVVFKHKGASFDVLPRLITESRRYDLVYIDGSHTPHLTMFDAVIAMHLANVGGIIMFDDYDRDELSIVIDNVIAAYVEFVEILDQHKVPPRQFAIRKIKAVRSHELQKV